MGIFKLIFQALLLPYRLFAWIGKLVGWKAWAILLLAAATGGSVWQLKRGIPIERSHPIEKRVQGSFIPMLFSRDMTAFFIRHPLISEQVIGFCPTPPKKEGWKNHYCDLLSRFHLLLLILWAHFSFITEWPKRAGLLLKYSKFEVFLTPFLLIAAALAICIGFSLYGLAIPIIGWGLFPMLAGYGAIAFYVLTMIPLMAIAVIQFPASFLMGVADLSRMIMEYRTKQKVDFTKVPGANKRKAELPLPVVRKELWNGVKYDV